MFSSLSKALHGNQDYRIFIVLFVFLLVLITSAVGFENNRSGKLDFNNNHLILTDTPDHTDKQLMIQYPHFIFKLLPINNATAEQLCLIPGIGPSYAKRILDWRLENHAIQSRHDLLKIRGIGSKRADVIVKHISFEVIDD